MVMVSTSSGVRRRGGAWLGSGMALALAAAAGLAPLPAAADTVVPPSGGNFTIRGAGYGHGFGMSQYGAYGAAQRGLGWRDILSFYYPGTRLSTLPAGGTIKVWITADSDSDLRVRPTTGLRLSDADGDRYTLPTGPRYRTWRVTRSGGGYRLSYLGSSGGWTTQRTGLSASTWTFANSAKVNQLVLPSGAVREYRGTVSLVPRGSGARTVNRVGMEDYVRSVVPSEMPTSWLPDAVRTQAVAARTYAARIRAGASSSAGYDICDTTSCQVYGGRIRETAGGDAAVAATRNVIVRYGSSIAFTQFSSANGGHSGKGSAPYLVAQPDPYDGVIKSQSWTRTVTAARIGARWSVGTVRGVQVTRRDGAGAWGGRVLQLKIIGSARSVTVTGITFKYALGLRDTLFTLGGATSGTVTPPPSVVSPPGPRYAAFPRTYTSASRADLLLSSAGRVLRYPVWTGGTVGAPVSIGTGFAGYTHVVHAGDWNGDGYQDVIARTRSDRLRLFPGTGTGALGRSVDMGFDAPFRTFTTVGDASGDGRPDLVAITRAGNLRLYRGDGRTGQAGASTRLGSGWTARDWLRGVGDMTGDGRPDVVTKAAGRLWIYAGTRTGFGAPASLGVSTSGLAAITSIGDFDGDRRSDLLARSTAGRLVLYPGTGTGGLRAAKVLPGSYAGTLFVV